MFLRDTLLNRLRRGCETLAYPHGPAPALPDRHGGALRLEAAKCPPDCAACVAVCPTLAITRPPNEPTTLDLGRCVFCAACVRVCPTGAVTQTGDHRMAVRHREDLLLGAPGGEQVPGGAMRARPTRTSWAPSGGIWVGSASSSLPRPGTRTAY
jgi:formate hydrogenlyase subunit 6/NADH:ubiquinone oxidoreductase subunit I